MQVYPEGVTLGAGLHSLNSPLLKLVEQHVLGLGSSQCGAGAWKSRGSTGYLGSLGFFQQRYLRRANHASIFHRLLLLR